MKGRRGVMSSDAGALAEDTFGPMLSRVSRSFLYIDTLSILMKRPLSEQNVRRLRALNGAPAYPYKAKARWSDFPSGFFLQRPTPEAIAFLHQIAGEYRVTRFDAALDLIVPDRVTADALKSLCRKHVVQPYRGKRRTNTVGSLPDDSDELEPVVDGSTDYSSAKAYTTRNTVMYSGRSSKITGERRCHLEFRTMSSRMCSNYGMSKLLNFEGVDLAKVIQRHAQFAFFDDRKLGQLLDQKAAYSHGHLKGCSPKEARRRWDSINARIMGVLPQQLDAVRMQDWLDEAREHPFWKPIFSLAVLRAPVDVLLQGAKRAYPSP